MEVAILGIDLGKNSCSLVGFDLTWKVLVRLRMRRDTAIAFCAKLPACIIAMEACSGPITWDEPSRLKVTPSD